MTTFEIISMFASVIAVLGNALMAVIWFNVRKLIGDMEKLKTDMQDHRMFSLQNFAKDSDVKDSLKDLKGTMNVIQGALNTNTNMTAVISEKISSITEKLNNKH